MPPPDEQPTPPQNVRNVYPTLTIVIQIVILAGAVIAVLVGQWFDAFLALLLFGMNLTPLLLERRYRIAVPPEFQFLAVLFLFLSIFIGSVLGFYERFPWWDTVLHTSSGFLLGLVGFLAVFLLNRTDRIPVGMTPGFICFFAVTFAVFLGVTWEIYEYISDQIVPAWNMQARETGVNDTMKDLIVDTIGAIVVAVMGWIYLRSGRYSFIADGIRGFIQRNPRLFAQKEG